MDSYFFFLFKLSRLKWRASSHFWSYDIMYANCLIGYSYISYSQIWKNDKNYQYLKKFTQNLCINMTYTTENEQFF